MQCEFNATGKQRKKLMRSSSQIKAKLKRAAGEHFYTTSAGLPELNFSHTTSASLPEAQLIAERSPQKKKTKTKKTKQLIAYHLRGPPGSFNFFLCTSAGLPETQSQRQQ